MDIVSIGSLIFGFAALIVAFIFEEGVLSKLISPTSALIIFGGTFAVLGVSFPSRRLAKVPKLIGIAFSKHKDDRAAILAYFEELAVLVRKDGLLSLEQKISTGENLDPFLVTGLQMVIDGTDLDNMKHTLETKISNMEERHSKGIAIFEAAGGYAPTMGVVGTVLGLINVLADLSDTEALGGKVATAFIATLYGIASANILWLPIATKLKELDSDETVTKYMMLDGIIMLQNGSNPILIREHLEGYLEDEKEKAKARE